VNDVVLCINIDDIDCHVMQQIAKWCYKPQFLFWFDSESGWQRRISNRCL